MMRKVSVSISSPRGIRQNNVIAVLQKLFDHGRLSRAELARHLGLNRSSSGHIVSELVENGLVRQVADHDRESRVGARAGRPGILLELEPQASIFLGVEIGVEHITTLHMDLNAKILHCTVEPFDGPSVAVDDAIKQAVAQAFAEMPRHLVSKLEGFGLSVPAQFALDGRLLVAPLLGWKHGDLAALTQNALGAEIPVIVENEANAFAFGEGYRNRRTQTGVTLFFVIETGVGGGVVIDGRLFRGGNGLAGEIGHLEIRDGLELEQVLGLQHLLKCHREAAGLHWTSLDLFLSHVRQGEPKAVEISRQWASDLATAIVAAGRLLDPNRVVLGGSLAALYPFVARDVLQHVESAQAPGFPVPEIAVHQNAQSGSAYGAACMLHQRFLSLENRYLIEGTDREIPGDLHASASCP